MKSKDIILILFILNVIGIVINIPILFYDRGTFVNSTFSILYLLIWTSSLIYAYMKKQFKFSVYILGYWILALIISIIDLLVVMVNAQVPFAFNKFSSLEYLLSIIFFTPFYGIESLLKLKNIEYLRLTVLMCITFIILEVIAIKNSKRI